MLRGGGIRRDSLPFHPTAAESCARRESSETLVVVVVVSLG
jgi:hypothetical protein